MDHYFTNTPPNKQNRREILFRFLGVQLSLVTDSGVFSKGHVDEGTKLLIQSAHEKGLAGKVLDLGCGYGVIGLTLKKLNQDLRVSGIDINSYAVELANENARKNKLDVQFTQGDGINTQETYDHILLNPPIRAGKKVIYSLFADAYDHLDKEGKLTVVMRKQHGAPSAIKYCEELFSEVTKLTRSKGFWVFQCNKTSVDNL